MDALANFGRSQFVEFTVFSSPGDSILDLIIFDTSDVSLRLVLHSS